MTYQPEQYNPGQHQQRISQQARGQVQSYGYAQPAPVAPKSTAAALIMSLFIPGLGSMYAGKAGRGILILFLYLLSWVAVFFVVGLIAVPVCWIWGMYAGYADARRWNRDHGIIS